MPLNDDNFKDFSSVGFNKHLEIDGLDYFKKNLEKHFFSQVTVRNYSPTHNSVSLVVELDCNFGLIEALHHFEKNTWGNFESHRNSFSGALNHLKERNSVKIDVEELSIFLQDTSIILNRIYDQSISEQLQNIFSKINEHVIYFTKGLTEIPNEIYIPVFEDNVMENSDIQLMNSNSGKKSEQSYFSFWGLYHFSEEDAVVYDVDNQLIIRGNLQMLNR